MASEDFRLNGRVVLDDSGFDAGMEKLIKGGENFSSNFMGSMTKAMLGANLLTKAVELTATAIRSAVSAHITLETQLAKVNTVMDKTIMDKAMLRNELFKVSGQTGIWAEELASASYEALSAGIATRDLGEFVKNAAILSQAGFMSTTQAVNVLTSTLGAYGKEVLTVEQISNKLVTAQANGKFTIDELSRSMASVTPVAASLGVSFDEVLATIAAITMTGTSVSEATTRMRAALISLSSSGSKVGQVFKEMTGKTFKDFIDSGKSVGEAFEYIAEYSNQTGVSLTELMGSSEGALAVLQTLTQGGENYRKTLSEVQKESMKAEDTAKTATDHIAHSWGSLGNRMKVLFLSPGGVFDSINNGLLHLADSFVETFEYIGEMISKTTKFLNDALNFSSELGTSLGDKIFGREKKTTSAKQVGNSDEMNSLAISQANATKVSEAKAVAEKLAGIKKLEIDNDTKLKEKLLQNEIDFTKKYNEMRETGKVSEAGLSKMKTDFEVSQQKKSLEAEKNVLIEKQNYYKSKTGFEKEMIETSNKLKELELKEEQLHTASILANEIVKSEGIKASKDAATDLRKQESENKRQQQDAERTTRELEQQEYRDYRIAKSNTESEFNVLKLEKDIEFFNKTTELKNQFWTDEADVELANQEYAYEKFMAEQQFKLEQLEAEKAFYEGKKGYAEEYAQSLSDIKELEAETLLKSAQKEEQLKNKDLSFTKKVSDSKEQLVKGAYNTLLTTNKNVVKALGDFFTQSIASMCMQHGAELMYDGIKTIWKGKLDIAKGVAMSANPLTPGIGAPLIAAGTLEVSEGTQAIAASALFGAAGAGLSSLGGSSGGGDSGGSSSGSTGYTEDIQDRNESISLEKEKSVTIYTDGDMKDVMLSMLGTLNDLSKDYNNIEIVSR